MEQDIGDEYQWAKEESLLKLKQNDVEMKEITTDPDSSAYRAAEDLFITGVTNTEPEHYLDTRHISENHRKFVQYKHIFKLFPSTECNIVHMWNYVLSVLPIFVLALG